MKFGRSYPLPSPGNSIRHMANADRGKKAGANWITVCFHWKKSVQMLKQRNLNCQGGLPERKESIILGNRNFLSIVLDDSSLLRGVPKKKVPH